MSTVILTIALFAAGCLLAAGVLVIAIVRQGRRQRWLDARLGVRPLRQVEPPRLWRVG